MELTDREKEILELMANDTKKPDLAKKLDLSPRTIESYQNTIRAKLGCDTLYGAVGKFIKNYWQYTK